MLIYRYIEVISKKSYYFIGASGGLKWSPVRPEYPRPPYD
jgi:hypothetical protein